MWKEMRKGKCKTKKNVSGIFSPLCTLHLPGWEEVKRTAREGENRDENEEEGSEDER